jgi:flagellar basal-body rod modification protein FlgD
MPTEISNWWTVAGAQDSNAGTGTAARTAGTGDQINKETFLQLLVAQIRHQDPLNPSDGIQFLTQLAQFSELEQLINMNEDLDAIRAGLNPAASGGGDGAADRTTENEPAGRPV